MAKITITIENENKTAEELRAIAEKVIKEAEAPNKNNWCNCPADKEDIWWDGFGGGTCQNCGGHTF